MKILHRVAAEEDRLLMGTSMHMSDEQIEFLSNFRRGQGAVYSENDNEPKMLLSTYANKYLVPDRAMLSHETVLKICEPENIIGEETNECSRSMFCSLYSAKLYAN